MTTGSASDEAMLATYVNAITQSGRYRIVELFERRARYHAADGSERRRAVFVDVETTGVNTRSDEIIQLALVPFDYGPSDGRIFDVHECVTYLEEPARAISERITELTGITPAMVAGQRIDDDHVAAVVREANLIVAHNANFDRRFLERRLPIFQAKAWACSRNDVPWEEHGFASTKLEWLAYKLCGMFYEAHHADSDCYMAVHLLASRLPSGELVMSRLLRSARQTTVRLAAVGAPYEMKDVLKRRGYRWNDGTDGMPRAWWKTLPEPHADAELEWLSTEVYPTAIYRCVRNRIDATIRHSGRQPL